ncbi:hypothetical protein CCH79_00011707, partial [Gambusia affinis]
ICIIHRVSLQTEPTQLNISTPTNSTIGNTTQFYVGKATVSSGKIISNNASDEESIMFSTPKTNAQECCKTTQSSDSETSQPASTFSEGNSSFSHETPAPAEAENIFGTTASNALQTPDIKGGNTPTSISSPLSQSETTSVSPPTQAFSESQINELSTTLTDMPGNIQTNLKTTKMSTQSHTETKESDATKGTTLLTTNTVVTRNTQSGQKTYSEANPVTDYKVTTNFTVVPGTTEPTSTQNQSTDSLKTDSASTQRSAGTTKPDMSTTEMQMESTEPATLRTLKTETSTTHYTQTQMMVDMTTSLPPLLETSATGTTRKSTSSRPPATPASHSEVQTSMKNDVRSSTTHFQNTSGQNPLHVTTETQTAVVEETTTVSSRTSTITAQAVANTNYDTSSTTGQVSPTASNQPPTQAGEKTTEKQEAGRTMGHMGTTVNTTPHTTASLVTSPQETTAAHTITPEEEPETASAAWTMDQHSSTLQSVESSSSQQPQSVSLVPSRSSSSSVPAQSSSHSTTEEAHSSTSSQVNGTTNMEKATVKSTAAEYGSTDTTDSNLYTSANLRYANTTQLEYDASTLSVSRNRTVFFKYSPRVVIVKPLVFDYPVVERVTFLSNDTDKIDGTTN